MSSVIAATPVKGSVPWDVARGSQVMVCASCGAEVWAAPSSQALLVSGDAEIYCLFPCAPAEIARRRAAGDELEGFGGAPGWEAELSEELGAPAVADIQTFLTELNKVTRRED